MTSNSVARLLNEIQNTKKFYGKLIREMYDTDMKKFTVILREAGLLK